MLQSKDIKDIFPIRKSNTNKGDYGYVAIMGGCINYLGAVKLANISLAALRAGCGVSKLIVSKSLSKMCIRDSLLVLLNLKHYNLKN